MVRPTLALLFGLVLVCVSCSSDNTRSDVQDPVFEVEGRLAFVDAGGDTLRTINVDIADTDEERRRGLMRQRSLGYDRGMLFIFERVDKSGMWMKNTPMPLDIVFVSPDSQVINIAHRTTPFSEKTISPTAPKKYVVEVRAGFAKRYGLSKRSRIRWSRID